MTAATLGRPASAGGECAAALTRISHRRPYRASVRILVVEDEPRLAELIAQRLRREGMAVDLAADGADALAKLHLAEYDTVVLDRDLPEVHGDVVCRRLAEREQRPRVIMLT